MILMYMQVISTSSILHRSEMNVFSKEMVFVLQAVSLPECLLSFANFLKSTSATIKKRNIKTCKNTPHRT